MSLKTISQILLEQKNKSLLQDSKSGYVSTYGTTRIIARFISFFGWVVVVLSVLLVSSMGSKPSDVSSPIVLLFALAGVTSGLLLVLAGQLTRAMVDTADNTGEILFLMKRRNGSTSKVDHISNSIYLSSEYCANCFFSSKIPDENVNTIFCSNKNLRITPDYRCDKWKPKV